VYTFRPWNNPTDQERAIGKYTDSIDLLYPGNDSSSAEYFNKHIKPTPNLYYADGDKDLMFYAINQIGIDGLVLEFGTWKGYSVNYIAGQLPNRLIHGFDVFNTDNVSFKEGADWNGHDFTQAELPLVKSNVQLHAGWFHRTLPGFVEKHPEPCALLHIDCDNYDGTVDVLKYVNIAVGTIIVFDEYINVPNWEVNEHKAWLEYCTENGVKYEFIAINTKHQQLAIRINDLQINAN